MEKTRQEHIQEIAYFMWLNRGKPEGKDLEIWAEAERIYEITQSGFTSNISLKKSETKQKQDKKEKASKPNNTKKKSVKAKTIEVGKIIPMIKQKVVEKPKLNQTKKKIKIVLHKK